MDSDNAFINQGLFTWIIGGIFLYVTGISAILYRLYKSLWKEMNTKITEKELEISIDKIATSSEGRDGILNERINALDTKIDVLADYVKIQYTEYKNDMRALDTKLIQILSILEHK
jgi:hypothetical protein